jgi:hypothetical protein
MLGGAQQILSGPRYIDQCYEVCLESFIRSLFLFLGVLDRLGLQAAS